MARGHQKIQSQQKNAKKQAEMKKSKGHDQKTAAKAALSVHLQRLQVPDARPKNVQAALREQTPQIPAAPGVGGSGGINYLDVPH